MNSDRIDILLTTYNGEAYLIQLLDSLLNQSYENIKIIIRDDNSKDFTNAIIQRYSKKNPKNIYILNNEENNLGTIRSFEKLLNVSDAKYIMFCDQDDVWLPNKVEITLLKMKEKEKLFPESSILIHTDLTVVNKKLNVLQPSFWKLTHINPSLLRNFNYLGVFNGITGCTCMINKKAKEICLPFSVYTLMHDSWIALCISKYGKIDYINKSTILYRQHDLNQIGANEDISLFSYIKLRVSNFKQVIKENNNQFKLLNELNYGTKFKYYCFKILYFIRARL